MGQRIFAICTAENQQAAKDACVSVLGPDASGMFGVPLNAEGTDLSPFTHYMANWSEVPESLAQPLQDALAPVCAGVWNEWTLPDAAITVTGLKRITYSEP